MRNPDYILGSLKKYSTNEDYQYNRIYRTLYNPLMFQKAYIKIYAKEGNMTEGTDNKTIDGMSLEKINNLVESLKDETYKPKPVKRMYIPKKNGKLRPLGIPSFEDKLVQEVIRQILEAIYEDSFSENSHGFRPNKSCHTALFQIREKFRGTKWFIEGDIKGFFENIDHHILINILRKRIKDEKFIKLIWKFLRNGYLENWVYNRTYSGTPQGEIISPILANIYLNELDRYMEEYKERFDKGIKGKPTSIYSTLGSRMIRYKAKCKPYEPMDENFKRLNYVRYADDFIIGVIGSKDDAEKIKQDIKSFVAEKLKLELSDEKTLITHNEDMAKFLGYGIKIRQSDEFRKNKNGKIEKKLNGDVCLILETEVYKKKLLGMNIIDIQKIEGKEVWKSKHRPELINLDDIEILSQYNAEIRELYNFYKLADNVYKLNDFKYHMEYSMYKTLANKYKTSKKKIIDKYRKDGVFQLKYETKKGIKTSKFYNGGFSTM